MRKSERSPLAKHHGTYCYWADFALDAVFKGEAMGEVVYLFGKPVDFSEEESELLSCTPILIWFPFFGRNAWHSTWVKRYRAGALQPERRATENYITEGFIQGSNWGFQVLPGFYLKFSDSAYLLTEINSKSPFSKLIDASLLKPFISKSHCLKNLKPSSPSWAPEHAHENGVIVQETTLALEEFRLYVERSDDIRKIWTVGTYRRQKSEFGDWLFNPISESIDLGPFDTIVDQLEPAHAG
jgi:hypothetical protein